MRRRRSKKKKLDTVVQNKGITYGPGEFETLLVFFSILNFVVAHVLGRSL